MEVTDNSKDGYHEHYFLKRLLRICLDFITRNIIGYFIEPKRGIFVIPAITDPILLEPAISVADKIRHGQVTSEQVVRAYVTRIKEVDPLINAVTHNRFDAAIADAQELDRQIKIELESIKRNLISSPSSSIEMISHSEIALKVTGTESSPNSPEIDGVDKSNLVDNDLGNNLNLEDDKDQDNDQDKKLDSNLTNGNLASSNEDNDSSGSSNLEDLESLIKSSSLLSKPLLGIPFTGKDSIAVNGLYQTAGMFCRKFIRATVDAKVTQNMKNIGGMICLGITNVPEYCFWFDSANMIFGRTNNPYDLSHIPGGSSGGQGAVISYAGSIIGQGSDIGGSIRIPANFCGIFGHKPTPGIIPTSGHYPKIPSERIPFLSFGPLVRYASDIIPTMKVMAGGDDSLKKHLPRIDSEINFRKVNIFWMDDNFGDPLTTPVDPEIKKAIHAVAMHFNKQFGSTVRKVSFPLLSESFDIFMENYKLKTYSTFASALVDNKYEPNIWFEIIKKIFGLSHFTWPAIIISLMDKKLGVRNDRTKIFEAKAKKLKNEMIETLDKNGSLSPSGILIPGDDNFQGSIFLYPSHPELAPKHHTTIAKFNNVSYTSIFNILGFPVTQVPLGLNREGLPIGIQVIATPFNDHLTIAAAIELEKHFGGWVPPCKLDIKKRSNASRTFSSDNKT